MDEHVETLSVTLSFLYRHVMPCCSASYPPSLEPNAKSIHRHLQSFSNVHWSRIVSKVEYRLDVCECAGEVHGPRIQVFAPAGVIVRDVFREIVLLLEHRYPKLLPLLNGDLTSVMRHIRTRKVSFTHPVIYPDAYLPSYSFPEPLLFLMNANSL